ncbi:hypothetical protein [Duganella callida]|uniref:Uncharacterized protein n=1 Tax=Duganella callida TaxID=2561932 RepID=A0A4Y9SCB3_9BURK|nr:hypothetical protein [Duganella callida]TFW17965.1 hypothetical protein E4L98_19150 [Duganella callida]
MSDLMSGCWAKLERSQELLDLLSVESAAYFEKFPVRLEQEFHNYGHDYSLVAYGEPFPPPRIAVIAGEVIHHLRSSLDHLVSALVLNNGNEVTKSNQFPICSSRKAFKDACDRGQLKGVAPSARAIIESVQPYTTPVPNDTILSVVSEYDNADKHRLLVVVAALADVADRITIGSDPAIAAKEGRVGESPEIVGFGPFGPKQLSKTGVPVFTIKLGKPAPEFKAEASVIPNLAFQQCGRVRYAPLVSTLQNILHGVRGTIILFKSEFVR